MGNIVFKGILDGIVMDRIIRDYEYTMPTKHFHREYEIYYLLEGTRYYFIENETYIVKKGSLVIVNSFQIHKTASFDKLKHDRILLEFSKEPLENFFESVCHLSLEHFFAKNFGVLELDAQHQTYVSALLFTIMEEMTHKSYNYQTIVHFKLSELLIFIERCRTGSIQYHKGAVVDTAKHKKVHEIAGHIQQHYSTDVSLEQLSKIFYVSKCYLSRIFKEVTGLTVHEYLNIQRIRQAQLLLADKENNISEIATAIGYENTAYFIKVFKKYTETSPLQYRKKLEQVNKKVRTRKHEQNLEIIN